MRTKLVHCRLEESAIGDALNSAQIAKVTKLVSPMLAKFMASDGGFSRRQGRANG